MSYMGGTAAPALGLTHASGAILSATGGQSTSASAFMYNLIQNENSHFGSFQVMSGQLADADPAFQADLAAWAQSTNGLYTFLDSTTSTPPAGTSVPTTDPAGTFSGPEASAPTPAAGTYTTVTGTTSAADIIDPAGAYSLAGAATLEFDGRVAAGQTASFSGSGGKLALDNPAAFAGQISGFDTAGAGSNDMIAVAGPWVFTGFTENAACTEGALGFANGSSTLSLTLLGDYNPADFVHKSGPNGSTLITYA